MASSRVAGGGRRRFAGEAFEDLVGGLLRRFGPDLYAKGEAVGLCGRGFCLAGRGGRPGCRRIGACRRRREFWSKARTQAGSAPICCFAGESDGHVLKAAFGEGEEDDAVVGGDVDEAMAGEVFEHAFADAVIGGGDAEGEGVAGAFGGLDFAAVDGDDLAEFGEGGFGGFLEEARRCTRRRSGGRRGGAAGAER